MTVVKFEDPRERELRKWLKDRPKIIQEMALKIKPWKAYRIKATGQECSIYSFSENGTITVNTHNCLMGGQYRVFGYKPEDLEEIAAPPAP